MDLSNLLTAVWLEALYQKFTKERGSHVHRKAWFRSVRRELLHQLKTS